MAKHLVFAKNTEGKRMDVGMSTSLSFDPVSGTLAVYWKRGEPTVIEGVAEGDPIWISCKGSTPDVRKAKLPRRKASLLAWILGFPKEIRTFSEEEYQNLIGRQRKQNSWWNYQEYTREGRGWALAICNRADCGGIHMLACFVSDEAAADKESVKDILTAWGELRWISFPRPFVERILRERFGLTESDLEGINSCF